VEGTSPTVEECVSTMSGYGASNRIVLCKSCGLTYASPRDSGLTDLYKQVIDNEYIDSWEERAKTFRKHLMVLKGQKAKGELLDIGCYAGIFLDEAKKAGYNVTGIEPSRWAADFARNKTGAEVLCGGWNEVSLPENHFDIVTMWDVIEHFDDPSACIKQAHRWLKSGGITAITTHDIGSPFARLMGKRYPWLMRFHLFHFTPKTLLAMLSKNGFEPVLVKYYVKFFSLKYILGRLGFKSRNKLLERLTIPLPSGDMFMVIARKI
jgi:2-polyprenyl-3-methyl-5-hydroxy-6-metoxy-1,4-benzoquinol methylase